MRRQIFLSSICALFLFYPCFFLAAEDLDRVNFVGDVRDGAGNVIIGARVKAIKLDTRVEREVFSDLEGRYRLMNLAPGRYELRIEADGFQTIRFENVMAAAGLTIKRDFYLDPATVQGELTVNAEKEQPLVDTTRTVVGGTLGRTEIDKLPTESRNPLDLIFTLPGVARPAFSDRSLAEGDNRDNYQRTPEEAGVFGLSGGSPFSNNITIEGLDNNDDRAARERFIPSIDSVEEVQVITNQFSAEYGRASGGRVNLRLRGGANQYHGRGFYYFRDESLNANSFFRNADPARGFRLPFQNQNPGVTFGGPIKRDRIFFFGGYEYDLISDQADIMALTPVGSNPLFSLPAPNGANLGTQSIGRNGALATVNDGAAVGLYDQRVSTPRRAQTVQSRVDFKFNSMHDGFALYTYARNRDERGFPGGRRTLDTLRYSGRDSQSIAYSDNFVFSPTLFNNARFQYSRLSPVDAPGVIGRPVVIINIDDPRDVAGNDAANPFSRSGNLTAGASTISGVDRRENRYQLQDTVSYVRRPLTFRAGVDLQRVQSRFVDLEDATGTFQFASPADFLNNRFSRYQHRFFTESKIGNTYTGLFVQNDWRPWTELTISFGLRWDYETALKDRNNFGPRLALAWAPRNSSKTVFRAGYGMFYNRALLRTLDDFTLTSNTLLIDTNNAAASGLLTQLSFPTPLAADDPRVKAFGVRESGFQRRLGADFRIPESYQASAGFERQLTRNLKFETNYVFHRGARLWREINANAPRLPAGFQDFSQYLISRDFDNSRDPLTNQRPLIATGNADVVRFDLSATPSRTLREGTKTVVVFGLNNPSTSNQVSGLAAARASLARLRPDPSLTQVEELQSVGSSFYHGLSFELTTRVRSSGNLRASYTLSKLTDDGVLNTSSPLVPGDFRRERSRSLLDARHRLSLSGYYETPRMLGRINLASVFNLNSAQPFNIGANGNDRNLDDVNNDRPNFIGDLGRIRSRRPGETLSAGLADQFSLPTIGTSGNLPRNAGTGPFNWTLNSRLSRQFSLTEQRKVELQLEAFNPLNATVYDFGAEFVDYNPASLGGFLTPRRTIKPRTMRLGLRFEF